MLKSIYPSGKRWMLCANFISVQRITNWLPKSSPLSLNHEGQNAHSSQQCRVWLFSVWQNAAEEVISFSLWEKKQPQWVISKKKMCPKAKSLHPIQWFPTFLCSSRTAFCQIKQIGIKLYITECLCLVWPWTKSSSPFKGAIIGKSRAAATSPEALIRLQITPNFILIYS